MMMMMVVVVVVRWLREWTIIIRRSQLLSWRSSSSSCKAASQTLLNKELKKILSLLLQLVLTYPSVCLSVWCTNNNKGKKYYSFSFLVFVLD
jgi:hypothetical protein